MARDKKTPSDNERKKKQRIFWRTVILGSALGVLFLALIGRLFYLQIIEHERYLEMATKQQTRHLTVSADRGTIYDSEGNVLAVSATVHNLVLSPKDLKTVLDANDKIGAQLKVEKDQKVRDRLEAQYNPNLSRSFVANRLAEMTGLDAGNLLLRMEKTNSQYEILARKMEAEETEDIRAFIRDNKLGYGVYLEPDTKRYYPYSSLGSHVVGFVGTENQGMYGVEMIYNDALSGTNGQVVTGRTGAGTELLSKYENYIDAQDGLDHHLTLNATIQGFAEKTLAEGIEKYNIQNGGFCIVMNPKTAGILAMASSQEYDLNHYATIVDPDKAAELDAMKANPNVSQDDYLKALGEAQMEQWRNRCVNDTYEPGSTFKTITLSAALEENAVSLSDHFFCSGVKRVANRDIHCSNRNGHKEQDLTLAVKNSCNPAFMEIAMRLGATKFYDYFQNFGLLNTTGIDLNGEGGSVIWSRKLFESEEGLLSLATASFGQTLKVTPIQLITAACAAVNGGHLLQPHVLDYTSDSNGNLVERFETTEVRQVVSEETSATVRDILEQVVATGTGKNAYQAGYRIGGKTGTSEDTENQKKEYIVSFLGVAPANDPQVVVLLAYDNPLPATPGGSWTADGTYISGGNIAAPMAGTLIHQILDYMGVEKQYSAEELSGAETAVPQLVGYDATYAAQLLSQQGLTYRTVGEGAVVTGQIPASGAVIPGGSQVILYMGADVPTEQVVVPDLSGKSPDGVKAALAEVNLFLKGSGSTQYFSSATLAAGQSLPPGALANPGTVVEVTFVEQVDDFAFNN